jgi:hypothetical protein
MTLRLRPHHVLCAIAYEGRDGGPAFTANLNRIVFGELRAPGGEAITIRITGDAGAFCAPCDDRRGAGCVKHDLMDRLDARHARALSLEAGNVLSWGACLARVRQQVKPDDLDEICEGCHWLADGRCKAVIADLLSA